MHKFCLSSRENKQIWMTPFAQTTGNACPLYSWEVVSSLTLGLALFWFQDKLLHSYRITERWGLEGTSVVTQPNPLPKQGHSEQGAQHHVQAGLEYLQRRRLHSLPGQPGPGLRHPQREEALPRVQLELPLLQFVPVAPCPVTGHHWKESEKESSLRERAAHNKATAVLELCCLLAPLQGVGPLPGAFICQLLASDAVDYK